MKDATWLGTRWEDTRKDTGEVRSRWVAQDFAFQKVDGEHFAGTPDASEIEAVHLRALACSYEIRYLDYKRAFLHAPEEKMVFSKAPKGFEQEGYCVRFKRKIAGRRDGSQCFSEWMAVQLLQLGWTRSVLHPCTFLRDSASGHRCSCLLYTSPSPRD